jgi:hypothetical protein
MKYSIFDRSNTEIPLTLWTFAFIPWLCCPVYAAALRQADPPSKEYYRLSIRLRNLCETAFHRCSMLQRANQYFFFSWSETESTWYCGHYWPILPGLENKLWWWWLWSNRWIANWQEKLKYSKKTCPNAILSITNPTWPDLGSNPSRRGGKPATNRPSYDTA